MSTTARSFPRVAIARGVPRASSSSTRPLPGPARVPSRARVPPRASASETSTYASKTVVCTREAGKNGALMNALKARGVRCLELPLVEAVPGDDAEALPDVLTKERWDWVCVTSPEAAKVFLRGYEAAGRPEGVRVAVVGAATGRASRRRPHHRHSHSFRPSRRLVPSQEHLGRLGARHAHPIPPLFRQNIRQRLGVVPRHRLHQREL